MRPAFLLMIAIRLAAAADASLATYFPPDTRAVVGIRLRPLADAGLFKGADTAKLFEKTPLAGFDPLKDLDEIVIATNGVGEKPPAIVVLRGRLPFEQLTHDATRYKDIAILESPEHPEGIVALIDGATAIAGEPDQVRAAIDRMGQSTLADQPWVARMEALRGTCAIWGFGEGLETVGAPGDLSSIDRFEFGVALDKGLRLAAEFHVRTPEAAEKMTASLRMIEVMMKGDKMMAAGKKTGKNSGFNLSADNGTLKFSLILPEAEFKKAIAEERGSLVAAVSSGLPSLLASHQVKPVPPAPIVVTPGKIVSNAEGDTLFVTLPSGPPVKH